jgi:lysophospholipase L1-like esterase
MAQDVSSRPVTRNPSSLQPRKHPTLWFLLLLLLELAVVLGAAELVAALFLPAGHHYLYPQPLMEPHAGRIYDYRPNQQAFTIDHPFVTNSLGFRDEREIPPSGDGELRILAMGDSMTAGVGVAAEDTYVRQLERLLQKPDAPVRVINGGVAGYGVWQELDRLHEKRGSVRPKIVTLQVHWNDLYPRPATVTPLSPGASGDPNEAGQQYWRIFKRSRVLLFLRERWASLWNSFSPSFDWAHRDMIIHGVSDPYVEKSYADFQRSLEELAALQGEGVVPIVVIVPVPMQVQQPDPPATHMQQRISAIAAQAGVRIVDLLPVLRQAYAEHHDLYIPWDNEHLTPRGHQVVADTLRQYLEQEQLLSTKTR